ncbi:zinc finger protein 79 [Drosophila santomea]|uniref:zinc finger protein 79 n=1 Tax=Drosophila santomea TaxID=129105 RepID=UPI0019541C04|nr:zinc finger protein 79 [Drosophila santomea]
MTRAMENACQCCKLRPGLSVKRGGSFTKIICLQCLHLDTFGTKHNAPSSENSIKDKVHVEHSIDSEDELAEQPVHHQQIPEEHCVVTEEVLVEDVLIKKEVIEENHNKDMILTQDSTAEEEILEEHPVIKEEVLEGEAMQGEYFIITECLEEPANGSCRVCLEQSDYLTNIFDDAQDSGIPIATTISQYSGMPVEKGDSFSEYICVTCLRDMQNAHDALEPEENTIQIYRQPKEEIIDKDSVKIKSVDNEVIGKPPHRCPQCPKIFLLAAKLQAHIRTHNEKRITEPPRLKCPKCPSIYLKRGCLEAHMWIHRPYSERESELEPPYRCPHCPKVFLYASFLQIHIQTHEDVSKRLSRKTSHKCAQCSETFSDVSSLKDHVKNHKEQMMFKCPLCMMSFPEECNLNNHDCAHTRFKCPKCSKFFQSQDYLDFHFKKSHTTKGPFKCIKCQQTFEKSSALKEHINLQVCIPFRRSKSPGQLFPCPKCPKKFRFEDNYQAHHATHKKLLTAIEKYNCTQCEKSYKHQKHLTKHILSHNRCVHCPLSFKSTYLLKQHTRTHINQLSGRGKRRNRNVNYKEYEESIEID